MNQLYKIIGLILLFIISIFPLKCQINYYNSTRLNEGWEFLRSDLANAWEAVRDFTKQGEEIVPIWSNVTLPHCYNAFDAVDPNQNYYQGPAWYRTLLNIENPYKEGRALLHFEGVGQKAEVYIHLTKVGSHVGGYDEWQIDITDAVNNFLASDAAEQFKGKIPLEIRVDNTRDTEMIPSDLSDFNLYGGLYRYVNLVYKAAISIQSFQTFATIDENGKNGQLSIKSSFSNYTDEKSAKINVKIYSPDNRLIKEENKLLKDWNEQELLAFDIKKPLVWSPDQPNLYSCTVSLTSQFGTMESEEKFGFRNFEFKKKGPFFLNGKRLLLKGTHRHEDHAGLGAAMTEELIIQEMEMMKEMGVNFIRLGHYQQSRIVLEQCDRLGILVWEEIPWCRGGLGGEIYKEQGRRMLTNMITFHI